MFGVAGYDRGVPNSKAEAENRLSGFTVFAADGFGLFVHKTAAQTTRDVITARDRVAELHQ